MRILRKSTDVAIDCQGIVLAIGNFDGVHRGHQAVIQQARDIAKGKGVPVGVMTFEPHSREFFSPDADPFRLTTLETKAAHLNWLDVDVMVALKFDKEFSSKSAEEFVFQDLVSGYDVVHVVVGYDFIFGHKRQGTTVVLADLARKYGFGLTVVEPVGEKTLIFSSTAIRNALIAGDCHKAAEMLGHWWEVESRVIQGDQRGRTIGFPTANMSIDHYQQPKFGVYAVRVGLAMDGGTVWQDGVANIGRRPTIGKEDILLEVHLLDFNQNLYGQKLRTAFVERIRDEKKFSGLDELKQQISLDCETAKTMLQQEANRQTRYADKSVN
jgi:riboflavin kinase / FMN adenylyltransferase